jgi:hypothetical protein
MHRNSGRERRKCYIIAAVAVCLLNKEHTLLNDVQELLR